VIGGGVAGPVAAMALRKAGIEATVYEAYSGATGGIGGTLAVAPNGLAALGIVGADTAVQAIAQPISRMAMAVGHKRIELPTLPGLPPLQLVHRNDLHRVLHDLAIQTGIAVEYHKRLVAVDEEPDGVVARFEDGSQAKADVLIGADGVHSTVRWMIDPQAPGPHFTGLLGFEAVVDCGVDTEPDTMTFAFGIRGYYLYTALPGGGTRWGVNLPQQRPMSLLQARAVPPERWLERLRETYADDEPGGTLVRHTTADALNVVGSLHIMPSVPHWWRGRMVLVGDAAHAPSNSSGQGASLAIESAVQLARCLRDLPDPASAFAAYESHRRERVERIAKRAARINNAKAPGPMARTLMPILMPIMMKTVTNPEKTMRQEQRYRIDWDAKV
jgi:2-polyprenyl-6-methoxyphenol hydroxylase-like FAD-dependent oxidoreductase